MRWSDEARLLVHPGAVYRRLASDTGEPAGLALLLRRPLLLALLLGATVSGFASGRFSLRLILDGVLSSAFLPATQCAALALVRRTGTRRALPFTRASDLFFAGNGPWLLFLAAQTLVFASVPPRALSPLLVPAIFACALPLAWSCFIDFQFFKEVMGRGTRGALADMLLFRVIAWTGALGYFFGIVAVSELPKLVGNVPP